MFNNVSVVITTFYNIRSDDNSLKVTNMNRNYRSSSADRTPSLFELVGDAG